MKIYAFSGLGADKRVFDYLKLDYELIPIDWIIPKVNESIESYVLRLSKSIDTSTSFGLIGVSFGGLIAVEMSKILHPKFTILISSIETKYELPMMYRLFGKTKLTRLVPVQLLNPPRKIAKWLFGAKNDQLLNDILDDTDLNFIKWAIGVLTTWKNTTLISNCFCIHGDKDKMFPISKKSNVSVVEGGAHFMIVDRGEEISLLVNERIMSVTTLDSNSKKRD